jgi:hypothetical protein
MVMRRRSGGSARRATIEDAKGLPAGWSMFVDESSGYPCYINDESGLTQWERPVSGTLEMSSMENPLRKSSGKQHHSRASTQMPDGWNKHRDEEGNRYYEESGTGLTSWDAPEGAVGGSVDGGLLESTHERSETVLPSGWGKDVAEDGDKYYFNENTGETTWDAPPGSVGGSSGN